MGCAQDTEMVTETLVFFPLLKKCPNLGLWRERVHHPWAPGRQWKGWNCVSRGCGQRWIERTQAPHRYYHYHHYHRHCRPDLYQTTWTTVGCYCCWCCCCLWWLFPKTEENAWCGACQGGWGDFRATARPLAEACAPRKTALTHAHEARSLGPFCRVGRSAPFWGNGPHCGTLSRSVGSSVWS